MKIDITGNGIIDNMDSAFPTVVKLKNNDLICGFSRGGGPEVTGGTHWARSKDNGDSWQYEGAILSPQPRGDKLAVNSLRLSYLNNDKLIAYGQQNFITNSTKFGTIENESIFCVSDSKVKKWSPPHIVPSNYACPSEVSNPMLVMRDGRWLAPSTLLPGKNCLGEKVVLIESCNEGKTWGNNYTVFEDKAGEKGFFEKKIIETKPGFMIAFAWTVELGSYKDLNNHFTISNDGGRSWCKPIETEIDGQTLTPFWLGENNFLVIYNYRKHPQGIKLAWVNIVNNKCKILDSEYLWQPIKYKESNKEGIDSFDDFAFGLPSLNILEDNTFLAVFWGKDNENFSIKWIKFKI
jgi:hypothetical protein